MIISKEEQTVEIGGRKVCFRESETIDLFQSRKWIKKEFQKNFEENGFKKQH